MLLRIVADLMKRGRAPQANVAQGLALLSAGEFIRAEAEFRNAIARGTDRALALHSLGQALFKQGRMDEAVAAFRLATEAEPANGGYWLSLGQMCIGDLVWEGVAALNKARTLLPDMIEIDALLHKPLLDCCEWDLVQAEVDQLRERARDLPPDRWTRSIDPWVALSLPVDESIRRQAARQHAARIAARASSLVAPRRRVRGEHKRLRLGYVSADFGEHATSSLATGLFEHHDRSRYELFGYSLTPSDSTAPRVRVDRAFEHMHDVSKAGADEIARRISEDEIDILVDLKGYTKHAKAEVFALRPAPVQVHYLGFPGSLQADFIDYFIADRISAPEGADDAFRERLVRLPGSYQVNDDRRPISEKAPTRDACGLPARGVVYCCFNQNFKIERSIFESWMRILAAVPDSVLWLFRSNIRAEERLRAAADANGVDPARLVFADWAPRPEHLARHRLADLFLDTRTCNAHTTASDALWAGLPVLTWPGESFAGRVSASLLHAVGLPELVAPHQEAYEEIAIALGREPQRASILKARLAANRRTMPLFRTADFTRGIEAAFERMWERHASGRSPESFAVAQV